MRGTFYFFSLGFFCFYGCSFKHLSKSQNLKPILTSSKETKSTRFDEALGLAEWEFQITKDPATNTVPKQKILAAINFENNRRSNTQSEAALSGMTWKERGPNNIGGRTRAIMVDPNDATKKTIWAGAVDGGLWKTTDITATIPNWAATNDLFSNLAITTLAYDSSNTDIMYFGTGEGWGNLDAVQGFGIWHTVDKGVNWTQLSSTTGVNFNYVNKIVVHPTNHKIYAATQAGLFLSSDYGATFACIGYSSFNVADIELSSTGRVHIGVGDYYTTRDYHYTDNDGTAWDPTATNFNTIVSTGKRVELAIAPTNGNILYALVGTTGAIQGIYKTSNGGVTWAATGSASWNDQNCAAPVTDFTRSQSWYDLAMAVNPSDANNVIIGGVDLLKTTNGGTSWTQISSWWGGCSLQNIHADQHIVYFEPGNSNIAYFGNDGGVWRTADATSTTPTITNKNTNYNVTQYYSTAIHPSAARSFMAGGAQDNGSHILLSAGIGSATSATGGDGGFCHIETDEPQYIYTSYVHNNIYRSSDTGNTFTQIIGNNTGPFITPWDFDNTNNILYASYTSNNIVRWSSMHGTPSGVLISVSGATADITHIKVSPNTATTIYAGTSAGTLFKITSANATPTVTNITGASFPLGSISCIEVQKSDEAHLLVTYSNYGVNSVWESTNSGSTWTSVEGNLPDLPVRWAVFNPTNIDQAVLATETGVYSTDNLNGGSTVWGINSSGMPNVRVDMLKIRGSDSILVAATHGRGMFTSDVFCTARANFEGNHRVAYINQPIQFTDASYKATSWAWDFDNNGSVDATTQNPIWAYGTAGYKTVKLTINSGPQTISLTNYILVLPNLATPFTSAQGGNFENNTDYFGSTVVSGLRNLWVRGAPTRNLTTLNSVTNAWKTQLGANIPAGNYSCALLSPSFNFYNAGTYTLNFRKSMEITYCNAPFAVQVQYSTDFGASWTRLGSDDGAGTAWYDRGLVNGSACPIDVGIFSDQTGWVNNYSNQATSRDVSFLAGNKNVAFRIVLAVAAGYSSGYSKDGFMVDDFTITSSTSNNANYYVETTTTSKAENFGPSASVDFYSPNGKILASLSNGSTHDYGLTTVTTDNAGTGAINYSTNTLAAKRLFQKTLTIVPTTNNTSGNYTAKLYYDASEILGWRAITANNFSSSNIIKCPTRISSGTLANGEYGTTVSRALYGAFDSSITATFSTGFSGFSAGVDISVLPVELINFTAIKNENDVLLNWSTASEMNNSGFDIERSSNAIIWSKIAFVSGAGSSTNQSNYSYLDLKASVNNDLLYYRLKQLDLNGSFKYSNICVIENSLNNLIVNITPQPVKALLQVTTSVMNGFEYSIITTTGKEMLQGKTSSNKASIDLSQLPAGVYYLQLHDGNKILSAKRFVKID